MGRRPRWVPEEGALIEVTCRTIQGRYLLRPSLELNELVVGVLGHAQSLTSMPICAVSVLSSHFHLLLDVDDAGQLSRFMHSVDAGLSHEVGRLVKWPGTMWDRRFTSIVVSDEEASQMARLRYVLASGVKEGLVERPEEWPGVNSVRALTEGEALEGWWFDRTKECAARWRGEKHDRLKYATQHQVKLDPLRCWRMEKVPEEEVRRRVADLVEDIVAEAAADRKARKATVRGTKAVMAERPHKRPKKLKKSPALQFHVATRKKLKELREAFGEFFREFLDASEKLRNGDLLAPFPDGCFPPAQPFIPHARGQPP